MRPKHLFFIALGVLVLGGIYIAAPRQAAAPLATDLSVQYSLSQIDIADDADEHELGLGGRTNISDDYGMLFVFETPRCL